MMGLGAEAKFNTLKKQLDRKEIISCRQRVPIMVFTTDDGYAADIDKWGDILTTKNIPLSLAINGSWVGTASFMTMVQIKSLIDTYGAEVLDHTYNHSDLTGLTEAQLRTEFETSQAYFRTNGLSVPEILVYPGGNQNTTVRKIAREYYRSALAIAATTTPITTSPINTYYLYRQALTNNTGGYTLGYMKAKVDECVANKGLLVWMAHSNNTCWNADYIQRIKDMIDYAEAKGVLITTMANALDLYGNMYDLSDDSAIGCDGLCAGISSVRVDTSVTFHTPMTYFPKGVTHYFIDDTKAALMPYGIGGILTVYKNAGAQFDRQEYRPRGKNELWIRTTDANSKLWIFIPKLGLKYGDTASRPIDSLQGYNYYDSTLNKPVWCITAEVREIDTFVLTVPINGVAQDGSIRLHYGPGSNKDVALTAGMTASQVDTAIRATTWTGWSLSPVSVIDNAINLTIYRTASVGGQDAPTFTDLGSTGITGVVTRNQIGVTPVWADATGVTV
jgi:peptidoglycan/xylan/chitin deacetylase (PgdA/CDA1 family)